jgi:hypothetical protein
MTSTHPTVTFSTMNPPNFPPNWVRKFNEEEEVWSVFQRRRALRAAISALPVKLQALAGVEEISEAQDWLDAEREVVRTVEAHGYWAGERQ